MRIECDVSYDADQDRLVGGDFVQEVNGKWVRSFAMPATHAKRLWDRLHRLDAAYRAENGIGDESRVPVPYPRGVAVLSPAGLPGAIDGHRQLVPLDLTFAGTQLRSAPAPYREIAQLVCAVEDPTTLAERRPTAVDGRRELVANLFGVLSCAHRRLHLALTRGAGSSIGDATISPAGHLQDLYFLVGPGDLPGAELRRSQRQDVTRALNLVIGLGGGPEATNIMLIDAVTVYWRTRSVPPDLSVLMERVALEGQAQAVETTGELAEAILSDGW